MEALIHHFKIFTDGFKVPEGEVYVAVESPRGELGCYLVSDGGTRPLRMHMRGPSFVSVRRSLFVTDEAPRTLTDEARRTASTIADKCAGVVPQHPPTMRTPKSDTNSPSICAMGAGSSGYTASPVRR